MCAAMPAVRLALFDFPDDTHLLAPADVSLLADSPEEAALLARMPGMRRLIAGVYNTLATGKRATLIRSPLLDAPPPYRPRRTRAQSRGEVADALAHDPTLSLTALARLTGLSRGYVCKLRQEVMHSAT
jgi:hypothetical protein